MAAEFGGDLVEHPLAAFGHRAPARPRPVGLILRKERSSSLCACAGPIWFTRLMVMLYDGANELRSGNVRGGQTGDLGGFDVGMPQHHGVAFDVDAAPPRPAGQLRVLPRCQRHVLLTVELDQPFQHHRARGHVDAQSQCLRGEYGFDQSAVNSSSTVCRTRQHPGVVCGQPAQQSLRHSW